MPTVNETGDNAATHAMMKKVVDAAGPVAARVIDGEYRLEAVLDVPFEEVRTAVFMATGVFLHEVVSVNQAAYAASRLHGRFSRTLEQGIEALHGFPLLQKLGTARWKQLRRHFGYDAVITLEAHLAGEKTRPPQKSLRAALFHFWGYAFAHDDRGLDRLLPLLELLPRAIPLGEIAGRPGSWAVLVA